jgi:CrcB protein
MTVCNDNKYMEKQLMRKYIYIGLGGILGTYLRYYIRNIQIYNYHGNVPINTLAINVSGSFLLALILTIAFEIWEINANLRLGITTGFLGAFTTFSTLCKETVVLFKEGDYFSSISYITLSTMLGLAAAYFGVILARKMYKCIKKDEGGAK